VRDVTARTYVAAERYKYTPSLNPEKDAFASLALITGEGPNKFFRTWSIVLSCDHIIT
jgi:hypothetical protein